MESDMIGYEEVAKMFTYTPSDLLYEAAFRYKKTKLWKKISAEEPFAIRFPDGAEGIVSIMGQDGTHCALSVYLGQEGFLSYHTIAQEPLPVWYLDKERCYSQSCLQIMFDNKEYLLEKEIENARAYAERNGIRFTGKNAFPHFYRFRPAKHPWGLKNEQEEQYLCSAADAAIAVADAMKKRSPEDLGFARYSIFLRSIPLVTCQDGKWTVSGMKALTQSRTPVYITPKPDSAKMESIRKFRAKQTMEARIVMFPTFMIDEGGDAPFFPYMLLYVNVEKSIVFQPVIVKNLSGGADEIADGILDQMIENTWKPSKILVCDERTRTFLAPLAEGIGTKLIKTDELSTLEPVLDDFMDTFGGEDDKNRGAEDWDDEDWDDEDPDDEDWDEDDWDDEDWDEDDEEDEYNEMIMMLEILSSIPGSEVRNIPPEIIQSVRELLGTGIVPPDLAARVRKRLKI